MNINKKTISKWWLKLTKILFLVSIFIIIFKDNQLIIFPIIIFATHTLAAIAAKKKIKLGKYEIFSKKCFGFNAKMTVYYFIIMYCYAGIYYIKKIFL